MADGCVKMKLTDLQAFERDQSEHPIGNLFTDATKRALDAERVAIEQALTGWIAQSGLTLEHTTGWRSANACGVPLESVRQRATNKCSRVAATRPGAWPMLSGRPKATRC